MAGRTPLYNAAELDGMFARTGVDVVVARSGRNVAYLSGMTFPGTLGRLQDFANAPRAALVAWPRTGEPTLFVSNIARGLAKRDSWVDDVRAFTEYAESPYVLVPRALRERGLGRGRIGVERREFGADDWATFVAELPEAEIVDVTDALEAVRNIKTPGEIELLREAAMIQDEAHLQVFGSARPGETEKELHARFVGAMIRMGADSAHGMLQASTNPITYGGEGSVPIERGVAVKTDYVCYLRGYAANLSRMAVMGPPSREQEDLYRLLLSVHRETVAETLRPGVEAREPFNVAKRRFEAAGFQWPRSLIGHSIGVWWHQEEPMLVPGESRQLRSGMVVCLEPVLEAYWHLQDEILITDDGPEWLSTRFNIDELFQMG